MKKYFVGMAAILFANSIYAQIAVSENTGTAFVMKNNGTWSFQQYAPNVFKVVFQPKNYRTNENVSNAVIEKPEQTSWKQILVTKDSSRKIVWKDLTVFVHGDTISFGDRAVMVGAEEENGMRGFKFLLRDGEKIFGGGERALPMNRRGYRFNLYNNPWYGYGEGADNLNYSVPFVTSSNHYALFFDNASKGFLDIGKTDGRIMEYGAYSGELNFYIIIGDDYPEILQSYFKLTGTQPMPPRWACMAASRQSIRAAHAVWLWCLRMERSWNQARLYRRNVSRE